jgi:hypothetical protein
METLLRKQKLKNGLVLEFHDLSNRYFGDYYRVLIEARCRIPVSPSLFSSAAELEGALAALGGEVLFTHSLEKMGVPGDEAERTRHLLIDGYLRSAVSYLESPRFPVRVVALELEKRRKGGRRVCLVGK